MSDKITKRITFEMEPSQLDKFLKWRDEQDAKVILKQKHNKRYADYGACGGGYTFLFSPTNIGTAVSVTNDLTRETVNLTDYDSW